MIEVLELMSDLLLGVGEGSPPDAFFSSLCEAICRLTSMKRAVLFRYDRTRRRVRAVGAHGIELDVFADLFVTIDSVPVAREALAHDRILEVDRRRRTSRCPQPCANCSRACASSARRWPPPGASSASCCPSALPDAPEMDEDGRHLLWTLGKAIAMASVAREVTAYDEQSRQLQQRIDLAREIHEGVVQRLFGVSLALSRDELLDADAQRALRRRRCRRRSAICARRCMRPLGHASRPTTVTFAEELERVRALYPDLEIVLEGGATEEVPASLEALAQSILLEAVRNAHKHAARDVRGSHRCTTTAARSCSRSATTARSCTTADGRRGRAAPRDASRRSSTAACSSTASQSPGAWQVRLVVPSGR